MAERGRPKLPVERRKCRRVELRLTVDEVEQFRAAAAATGVPLSQWIRDVLARVLARRRIG